MNSKCKASEIYPDHSSESVNGDKTQKGNKRTIYGFGPFSLLNSFYANVGRFIQTYKFSAGECVLGLLTTNEYKNHDGDSCYPYHTDNTKRALSFGKMNE